MISYFLWQYQKKHDISKIGNGKELSIRDEKTEVLMETNNEIKSCLVCGEIGNGSGTFLSAPYKDTGNIRFCFKSECEVVQKAYYNFKHLCDLQKKRFNGICVYFDPEGYDCKEKVKSGSSYCLRHKDETGCTKCGRLEK